MTQTDDCGFGTQIRKFLYFDATVRWGAKGFSVISICISPVTLAIRSRTSGPS
ncbi:hypothetical protein ASD8599_01366 [Ascidiaceihabitans donghaensis]|uniref:Uncharacterized protein n=1 Tax=Ascidiaceihabitans donghaensis TaxID=1510460 RepID=A0A2R8BCG9_9RHOB|nr:hypothetical protein ASD8599_01366 [Ascidiaceihabitans donghaensis]